MVVEDKVSPEPSHTSPADEACWSGGLLIGARRLVCAANTRV